MAKQQTLSGLIDRIKRGVHTDTDMFIIVSTFYYVKNHLTELETDFARYYKNTMACQYHNIDIVKLIKGMD